MNRMSFVFCVSTCLVAVALSSFALFQNGPSGAQSDVATGEELRELQLHMASMSERLEALEVTRIASKKVAWSPGKRVPRKRVSPPPEPTDLEEQLAALTQRLASLEDEETIARLAQSGEDQLTKKELRSALELIGDPEASPDEQFAAFQSFRRLRKTNGSAVKNAMVENDLKERDLVMPMLEIAQDTTLEPEFRAEVVRGLESKVPELRQPLLDLLAFEAAPEVRAETVHALMYHLGDSTVRQAITQASQEDQNEAVRARAERYLPKIQHYDRRATEAVRTETTATAAAGEEK